MDFGVVAATHLDADAGIGIDADIRCICVCKQRSSHQRAVMVWPHQTNIEKGTTVEMR